MKNPWHRIITSGPAQEVVEQIALLGMDVLIAIDGIAARLSARMNEPELLRHQRADLLAHFGRGGTLDNLPPGISRERARYVCFTGAGVREDRR